MQMAIIKLQPSQLCFSTYRESTSVENRSQVYLFPAETTISCKLEI